MKIGDLVTSYHLIEDQGVIIDKIEYEAVDRFDTGEVFIVLWNTGKIEEHKRWDLKEVEGI